ncbi:hypothetical protein V3C99_010625, partial [Haemonchus contortus]
RRTCCVPRIICACSTKDRCNDPASSLSDFKNLIRSLRKDEGVIVRQHSGGGGGGDAKGSAGGSESAHSSELMKRQVKMIALNLL